MPGDYNSQRDGRSHDRLACPVLRQQPQRSDRASAARCEVASCPTKVPLPETWPDVLASFVLRSSLPFNLSTPSTAYVSSKILEPRFLWTSCRSWDGLSEN